MAMEDYVGRRRHPVLAAFSGLTFAVLVSGSFWGGFVLSQNPPTTHVATAVAPAAQSTTHTVAAQVAATTGMSGMGSPASATRSTPALDAVARAAGAGKVYAAGSFAAGETTLPDGMKLATYTLDHGVKVFHLTASLVHWTTAPGQSYTAWAYNGTVPGPEIRVAEGDRVRIVVRNLLPEGTTVHWHGLFVPNNMDGVPMITQDPIKPGRTFTYSFTAEPAGTHMYHSHMDDLKQVTNGLYGAFILDPKRPAAHVDREFTMVLGDTGLGYIINGKSFPATTPLVVRQGDRVRIRMINMGDMYHPFHLHGFDFTEIAKDGLPIPEQLQTATNEIDAAPGGSYDVAFTADRTGVWAFHCHILDHVTGPNGEMAGMITVVKVLPR